LSDVEQRSFENRSNKKRKRRKVTGDDLDAGSPAHLSIAKKASYHTARVNGSLPSMIALAGC
jgi:hypothetical protein